MLDIPDLILWHLITRNLMILKYQEQVTHPDLIHI